MTKLKICIQYSNAYMTLRHKQSVMLHDKQSNFLSKYAAECIYKRSINYR